MKMTIFYSFNVKAGRYRLAAAHTADKKTWTGLPDIHSKNWVNFTRLLEEHFPDYRLKFKIVKKRQKRRLA